MEKELPQPLRLRLALTLIPAAIFLLTAPAVNILPNLPQQDNLPAVHLPAEIANNHKRRRPGQDHVTGLRWEDNSEGETPEGKVLPTG